MSRWTRQLIVISVVLIRLIDWLKVDEAVAMAIHLTWAPGVQSVTGTTTRLCVVIAVGRPAGPTELSLVTVLASGR